MASEASFEERLERSSIGTTEAHMARNSVSDETAAAVLRRADQISADAYDVLLARAAEDRARTAVLNRFQSAINLLYPDDMTPDAKRVLESIIAAERPSATDIHK